MPPHLHGAHARAPHPNTRVAVHLVHEAPPGGDLEPTPRDGGDRMLAITLMLGLLALAAIFAGGVWWGRGSPATSVACTITEGLS